MQLVSLSTFCAGVLVAHAGAEVLGYGDDYGQRSGGYQQDRYPYPQEDYNNKVSYGDSGYGAKAHPFIDAWFTFNEKGKNSEAVENTAVRVSVEEGKNDIIVLEHIFEDAEEFHAANSNRYNTNCATKDLTDYGHDEDHDTRYGHSKNHIDHYDNMYSNRYRGYDQDNNVVDRCVHEYEIGIELAAGESSRTYNKDASYPKNEPSTISVPSYGKLPVDVPSVKMTCVEVNDRADSEGAWAIWTDDRSVSLASQSTKYYHDQRSRRVQFNGFADNTMNQHIKPAVFENTNNEACWAARGSPKTESVGTCQAFVNGRNLKSPKLTRKVDGDVYSTLPCVPASTKNLDSASSTFEVDGCPAPFTQAIVTTENDACTAPFDCYTDEFSTFGTNTVCRDCAGNNDPAVGPPSDPDQTGISFYKKIRVMNDPVQGPIECKKACLDADFFCVAAEFGPEDTSLTDNVNCELWFGNRDQNNQVVFDSVSGFQCFVRKPCPRLSYCSAVENLSGCFPGCKPGMPEGSIADNPLVDGVDTPLLSGFCGYPDGAQCVNKPRSLKCTAIIEIGVKSSTVDYSSGSRYKVEKDE